MGVFPGDDSMEESTGSRNLIYFKNKTKPNRTKGDSTKRLVRRDENVNG